MKGCSVFIFIIFIHSVMLAQTGAIKVAKPVKQNPDTIKVHSQIIASIGGNYSFKSNNKLGYQAGIAFAYKPQLNVLMIGLSYCVENQYYQLSSYDKRSQASTTPFPRSENNAAYLKLPITYMHLLRFGSLKKKVTRPFPFCLGLQPEYLLKTKDQRNRLGYADFNQFNLAGFVAFGVPVKKHYLISFCYSNDFFDNLKDKNLYGSTGAVIGKQKSRTNLFSITLSYGF